MKELTISQVISKIKELISQDALDEALELIKLLIQNNKQINFLILQVARYKDIKHAINKNLIKWEEALIEKSKLRNGLLEFLDELQAEIYKEQVYIDNVNPEAIQEYSNDPFTFSILPPSLESYKTSFIALEEFFKNAGSQQAKKENKDEQENASKNKGLFPELESPYFINLSNDNEISDFTRSTEQFGGNINKNYFQYRVEVELDEIDELINSFLTLYKEWYFSAARIIQWGSKQKGFEDFSKISLTDMQDRLEKLYYRGQLVMVYPKERVKIYTIKTEANKAHVGATESRSKYC